MYVFEQYRSWKPCIFISEGYTITMTKNLWLGILFVLAGIAGFWGYIRFFPQQAITSFEECANAGYPVMEMYPPSCRTPQGQTFTQQVPSSSPVSMHPLIRVQTPQAGQRVQSSFPVSGEARGNWFFEASFPITVKDSSGRVLSTAFATAEGEWMTENFVPFTATITIPSGYTGPATVVVQKDNPSGLPEHDDFVSVPITIGK